MRVFGISRFLSGVSLYGWPSEELSLCPREGCPLENGVRVGSGGPGAAGKEANKDFLYISHRWLPLAFLHPAMNWW